MRGPVSVIAALASAVVLTGAVSCGGSSDATPTSPTVGAPAPAAAFSTAGYVKDDLSSAGVAGVTISGATALGILTGSSDATGAFSLGAPASSAIPLSLNVNGSTVVTRVINIRVPGADTTIYVMPKSFDLTAFNEMFRSQTLLLRWTSAPRLVIEDRVLQFTSENASDATASADAMTSDAANALAADLSWALPQLSGDVFGGFASVTQQTASAGGVVHVLNTGQITVARYAGLTAATGYWGYSRWQYQSDGAVIAGTMMLDVDFERSGSIYRRSLRAHELGHALGYNHVTVRASVMNSAARIEPTTFDLQGAVIAFHRPPGSRTPDTDPSSFSLNRLGLAAVWGPPIH